MNDYLGLPYSDIRYYQGFIPFLCLSLIGFWLIIEAIQGRKHFLQGLLNVPSWLSIIIGIVLQAPLIGYVYLGIRARLF